MTGVSVEVGLLESIYAILSEDIGPANPSLIIRAHRFLETSPLDQENLATLVELMVKSPKDRLFDWIRCSLIFTPVTIEKNLRLLLFKLETELEDKNFGAAVKIAGQIYHLDIEDPQYIELKEWKKMRKEFEAPCVLKACRRTSGGIWLPIMRIAMRSTQKVCNLVCYLYNVSGRHLLQWIHAIWSICNPDQVTETWYESNDLRLVSTLLSIEERLAFIEAHRRRENIVPIPDYALENPGMEHFLLQGSLLRNVWREGREKQMKWLLKCIKVWQEKDILPKNFVLPRGYLSK
jgi:hypothetical protein